MTSTPELIARLWQDLCEKDDRTSPADAPEMCLITFNEFAAYLGEATLSRLSAPVGEMETTEDDFDTLRTFVEVWRGENDHADIVARLLRDFASLQAEVARLTAAGVAAEDEADSFRLHWGAAVTRRKEAEAQLATATAAREAAEARVAALEAGLASLIEDADDNGVAFNSENCRIIVGFGPLREARALLSSSLLRKERLIAERINTEIRFRQTSEGETK